MLFSHSHFLPAAVLGGLLMISGSSVRAQESSPTQYALDSAVLHAESVNEPLRNRLSAIRTLQAFASGFSVPGVPETLQVIDADQTRTARAALEALMNDSCANVAEQALRSLSVALRFERDAAGLIVVTPANRDRVDVWIRCLPHIVRSDSHNSWTRRLAAEKLTETAVVMQECIYHDRLQLTTEPLKLERTVLQVQRLVGELSVITEQLIYERPGRVVPDYALVCENLLNALVSDTRFLPASSISASSVGGTKRSVVDRSQQPIAASSLPSAATFSNIASALLGVSETGAFDATVPPGLRITVPSGETAPVPQSLRMGRRIPGITLDSTSDSSRFARSRGAVGSARTGAARMVAPPPDAVPAAPPR